MRGGKWESEVGQGTKAITHYAGAVGWTYRYLGETRGWIESPHCSGTRLYSWQLGGCHTPLPVTTPAAARPGEAPHMWETIRPES